MMFVLLCYFVLCVTVTANPCVFGSPTNMQNMRHLSMSVQGYDDPNQRPLFHFFRNILQKNGTLILYGDSVMKQFATAMTCELERGIRSIRNNL